MTVDLVVKNTRIVLPSATIEAGLAIAEGKIVAVAKEANLPKADRIINAQGNFTLPGIVDVHAHFREPGLTRKEDFMTGSSAAVVGGVTTVLDMPNTIPRVTSVESFNIKVGAAKGRSYVDFGIFSAITEDNLHEVKALADAGTVAYKVYMNEALDKPVDGWVLREALRTVAETGLAAAVHAEDYSIIQHETSKMKAVGRNDPLAYLDSRPNIAEASAVQQAILLCKDTGCKLHFCHISTKEGVALVRKSKLEGLPVTAETCPHYLLMKREDMVRLGSILKICPPVRSSGDSEALWEALADESLDVIASDHSPHTKEEKLKESIWDVASGFPMIEIAVPLMLTQVNWGKLTLNHYVKLASENPARAYGLYPRKGTVQVGSDGDLTIVDMKKESKIDSAKLHSKSKITPFDGWTVKGVPIYTIIRGTTVMEEEEISGPPRGSLIIPERKFG